MICVKFNESVIDPSNTKGWNRKDFSTPEFEITRNSDGSVTLAKGGVSNTVSGITYQFLTFPEVMNELFEVEEPEQVLETVVDVPKKRGRHAKV